ncbi:hypothetical protein [Paracoccus sp. ME4]|uniref:hypothetical protein n=1 Tax=Paracoccus sp. ME4 TaxID=3138066 RepID=UPI00398AA2B4
MRQSAVKQSGTMGHAAATQLARDGIERIERQSLHSIQGLRAHTGSRMSRQDAMRRIHAAFGKNAIGYAHDEECRSGLVGYISTMRSASLYKGVGVVSAQFDLDPSAPRIGVDERLESMIDLHILKRLSQRAGVRDLPEQIRLCMPAIGWCAAANLAGIEARFVVATRAGLWFCRREPLPDQAGRDICGPVSRIVTFCAATELNGAQRRGWSALMEAGVERAAPPWPGMPALRPDDMRHLCSMVTVAMQMRNANSCSN